VNPVKCLRN